VPLLGGQGFEHLGLRGRAREPVEDVARAAVFARRALADDAHRQLVGDELARAQDGAQLPGERRVGLQERAEHVAGRNLRQPQSLL
jgi:hypothetical protein